MKNNYFLLPCNQADPSVEKKLVFPRSGLFFGKRLCI